MSKIVVEVEKWARRNALSVTAALKQLGVSTNIFYRWKNGSAPQMQTVHRIAGAIGVDVETLIEDVNPSTPATPAAQAFSQSAPAGDVVLLTLRRGAYNELEPVLKRYGALVFRAGIAGDTAAFSGGVPELLTGAAVSEIAAA